MNPYYYLARLGNLYSLSGLVDYGRGLDFGSIQHARKRTRRAKSSRRHRSSR